MLEMVLMRTCLMLYSSDFESDDDNCPYKSGKSRNSESRAFTLLSSVCWCWHQTLAGWPQSPTGHWVRHQLKKLIERECTKMNQIHILTYLLTYLLQGGPKMAQFFWYALTSSNINRFSKLSHCQNQEKTCNNIRVLSLKIPPYLKCVATLPCEMSSVFKATTEKTRRLL